MNQDQTPKRGPLVALGIFIAAAIALIWIDSAYRYDIINKTLQGSWSKMPEIDPSSPSGFEGGMRRLILPSIGADGLQWIMHTQTLLEQGGWRIRETDIDNAPEGREVHWSHSFIWWLLLLAKFHSLFTGWPLAASVEGVAPFANTLILVIFILTVPWIVLKKFGAQAACAFAFAGASIYPIYEYFVVGNPDHHGIVTIFCALSVLALLFGGVGWVAGGNTGQPSKADSGPVAFERSIPIREARFWFASSGLLGGAGLWVSAATTVPVLFGIGIGAVCSAWLFGKSRGTEPSYQPALWAHWGFWGAIGSLFFYLLEYFPSNMGMRLEVNHPLYALAWFSAGHLLTLVTAWFAHGRAPWSGRGGPFVLSGLVVGVLLLPALIIAAPDRYFWVADRFLWTFHKDYILEFRSMAKLFSEGNILGLSVFVSVIPLLAFFNLRLLLAKGIGPSWKGPLLFVIGPGFVTLLLALSQIRWFGVCTAMWVAALPLWLACVFAKGFPIRFSIPERLVTAIFFLALALQYPRVSASYAVERLGRTQSIGMGEAYNTVVRDLAHYVRRAAGDREVVVLSGPSTTNWMMFYGGIKGLGTLYWENLKGLKASAEIYAAKTEDEALRLLKARGVTHVIIFSADPFSNEYIRLFRGLPKDAKPMDAFAPTILFTRNWPRWVRPLHYSMPPQMQNTWVAILEIHPDQTELEARLWMGRFFASRGMMPEAMAEYEESLKLDPANPDANLEIAGHSFLVGNDEKARSHLEKGLVNRTPDEISETLAHIAGLCEAVGRHATARDLLERAITVLPGAPEPIDRLARLLATSPDPGVQNGERALALAKSNSGMKDRVSFLLTIALAYSGMADFENAAKAADEALNTAKTEGRPESLLSQIEAQRDSFAEKRVKNIIDDLVKQIERTAGGNETESGPASKPVHQLPEPPANARDSR